MAILCIEVLFFRENSYGFPSFAETVRAVRTFPLRVLRKQKRPENPMFAGSDRVSVVDNEDGTVGGYAFGSFLEEHSGMSPFLEPMKIRFENCGSIVSGSSGGKSLPYKKNFGEYRLL